MDIRKYLKNIISVSGLTFASQALSFLTTPVLSRIFSPADYGEIAVYSSIIAIMEACASLSYVSGIALDKDKKDAKATTLLCVVITIIVGILGVVTVGIINLVTQGSVLLRLFIVVLPIMIIFPDVEAAYEGWLKRCQRYNVIGIINIVNVAITFIFSLLMGLLGFGAVGLLVARCASAILLTIVVLIVVKKITDYSSYHVSIQDIKNQAVVHKKFPIFQMPLIIMNSFSGQLPTFIMTSNFPSEDIGYYSKAYSISSIPSQVIGKAVGSVYYQESALLENESEVKKLSKYTYKRLLLLSAIMVFTLSCFGPPLFSIVLGSRWRQAGVCSAILAPMIAGIFITQPLSSLLFIKSKQQMGIPIGIVMIIIRVITLLSCVLLRMDFFRTLYVYSISSAIMYIVINSYYLGLVKIRKSYAILISGAVLFSSWAIGLFLGNILGL